MSEPFQKPEGFDRHSLSDRVDAICDAFERKWIDGPRPALEAWLAGFGEPERTALFRGLLDVELEHRRRGGETATQEEYAARFPEYSALLASLAWNADTLAGSPDAGDETLPFEPGPPSRPGIPQHFGDYEIIGEIGRGGMGVVFKARQVSLNRTVAVKMIRSGELADEREVVRFRKEAEAAANLDHPGIVPVFEVGQVAGQYYFSMGFVEGQSLAKRVSDGPLPPREAAELTMAIAEAIQHAHENGVIHRDLKPGNVLLDEKGKPRVTDFGLAKRVGGETELTASGQVLGTPSYMPPEQASGKVQQIGPAADVYALGAVLYTLVTGRPPFHADNSLDTIMQVIERDPLSPRELNPSVPRDLETICLKCLEKEPARRYASAAALAEDVHCFLVGEPILARPTSAWERAVKWIKRQPPAQRATLAVLAAVPLMIVVFGAVAAGSGYSIQALIALGSLAAAAGFAGVLWQWRRANSQRQRAEEQRQQADTARREEAEARRRLELNLYYKNIALAEREWSAGKMQRIEGLLAACPAELRGWEWHCLKRLSRKSLLSLAGHTDVVYSVAISPDGRRLASASDDQSVRIWDLETGELLRTIRGHSDQIYIMDFSPDGQRLAAASQARTVRVWDVTTGESVHVLRGHDDVVVGVSYSPDGSQIASASDDHTVKLWGAASGAELFTLRGHTDMVNNVAYSPDGRRLASVSYDQTLRIWDVSSGRELSALLGHTGFVWGVGFSSDGKRIVSSGGDNTVKIWDAANSRELHTFQGHTGVVWSVQFSPDGKRVVSGSWDKTVKVWDAITGQEAVTLRGHADAVNSVAFSSDGRRVASASDDRTIKVWDATPVTASDVEVVHDLVGHESGVTSVAFAPDGRHLVSGGEDRTVRIWDVATGKLLLTLRGHTTLVTCVAYDPTGRRLASASGDKTIKIWDAGFGDQLRALHGHTDRIYSVAFSPDGHTIASGGWDRTVCLWDAAGGERLRSLEGHTNWIWCVAFSPDGWWLASASTDCTVRLWNAMTGETVSILQGHTLKVQGLAFNPDGQRIASASGDQTVRIWSVNSGETIHTLQGHSDRVYKVAFSPGGGHLASASEDETIKIWNTVRGEVVQSLRGHVGQVNHIAFSPDGNLLASASDDGAIKIWDLRNLIGELGGR